MDSVNSLIENQRKEIGRLMEGALVHLNRYSFDVSVLRRRVDVFDPETPLFAVKADSEPPLRPEDVEFIMDNLRSRGYNPVDCGVKGNRLLLLV